MTNYKIAEFEFWRPPHITPKAILVLVPPSNADGRHMVKYPEWKGFAIKQDLLLVGCFFQDHHPSPIEEYCRAGHGSGQALLDAIEQYGEQVGFNFDKTKILLWGFSAGGQFAYEFACTFPQKVGGFVANKGGIYYTALASEATRKIPGLLIVGEYDAPWRKDVLHGIYEVNKACGANWQFVAEQCGHSEANSGKLGRELFGKVLA